MTAKFHLYDARVWGWSLDQNDFVKNKGTPDEHVMDSYEEYFELYDAYVKTQLTDKLSLQVGRQSIWYGQSKTRYPNSFSLTSKHAHQSVGIYSHYHFAPEGAIEPFFLWKNDLFYNSGKKEDSYFLGFRIYDE